MMFDRSMPGPDALRGLSDAALITGIQDWARATAAADARRLAGIAELVARRCTDEHPDWACDDWDAWPPKSPAPLTVGHGRASGQMDLAVTLRDRLPHIGALFLAGDLPTRTVDTITRRTALVTDPDALAALDTHLAEQAVHWGPLSQYKLEQAVDAAVQRHDPAAVRRTRYTTRGRDFTIGDPNDTTGTTSVWGRLSTHDAALLQTAVNALVHSVCDDDPRTQAQRRADAFGALAVHATALACQCGNPACPADTGPDRVATRFLIHILADADALAAQPDPLLHGNDDGDDDDGDGDGDEMTVMVATVMATTATADPMHPRDPTDPSGRSRQRQPQARPHRPNRSRVRQPAPASDTATATGRTSTPATPAPCGSRADPRHARRSGTRPTAGRTDRPRRHSHLHRCPRHRPRNPLPPLTETRHLRPQPGPHLPPPRLRPPRGPRRHRPHHRLARRTDPPVEHQVLLPQTPPRQNLLARLDRPTTPRRHPPRHHPHRTHLHHQTRSSPTLPGLEHHHRTTTPTTATHPTHHRAHPDDAQTQTNPRQSRAHRINAERALNNTEVAEHNIPPPF